MSIWGRLLSKASCLGLGFNGIEEIDQPSDLLTMPKPFGCCVLRDLGE